VADLHLNDFQSALQACAIALGLGKISANCKIRPCYLTLNWLCAEIMLHICVILWTGISLNPLRLNVPTNKRWEFFAGIANADSLYFIEDKIVKYIKDIVFYKLKCHKINKWATLLVNELPSNLITLRRNNAKFCYKCLS